MDPAGLILKIHDAAASIDFGRKGFATRGKEQEGRISYEEGIAQALSAFQKTQATSDPQTIILAEYTFITQEFQLCDKIDIDTINSLTKALQGFDDAFLALQVVEDPSYIAVEKATPHNGKYRVHGFPKDSYHIACIAHRTRLQNILRTPGLDSMEKALLKQRFANLSAAQSSYLKKQKKVLKEGLGK